MKKLTSERCNPLHRLRGWLLSLLIVCGISAASAQELTVTGTVVSGEDGEPLIGATVMVKGTKTGTATDIDGNYSINARMGQILEFSYVGYTTREIKVDGSRIDVALLENSEVLNEVVVVGYGTMKKKLVTGATSQIKGDEIAKLNTTSPLQAMQGQLPGVTIASNSGQPGESMKVTIRGLGTIGNSAPLYLIDGIGGDINTLNPNDIESIDILKDAASAAIYGAQAANGVVLITTKKGREGSAKVTYDGYFGWQTVGKYADMLNSNEYMTILDEKQYNDGAAPFDWNALTSIWRTNPETGEKELIDTNWIKAMFKTPAIMQSHTIGVTGGNKTSTYAISLGYLNQEGIAGGKDHSNYSRYNFRINSDHSLFNGIVTIGEQASFVYVKQNGIRVAGNYWNNLRGAFTSSPLSPVYNAEGELNNTAGADFNPDNGNPYGSMLMQSLNMNKSATFTGNIYAQIEPIKGLRFKTVFGTVYGTSNSRSFEPTYAFSPLSQNTVDKVNQSMSNSLGMTWTNTISYDFNIKDHEFNTLIGMEAYRYSGVGVGAGNAHLKAGFDTWQYAWVNNGTATSENGLSASGAPHDEARSVSYFGRIGWNWKERYMVNVTVRGDGSSRFARGHRYGVFPSVSAGWNITSENFMEEAHSWLDFLKIRGSWGQVGNQNIGNYMYLAPITSANINYLFGGYMGPNGQFVGGWQDAFNSNYGAYPSRLGNFDLTWETSEQMDFGFDARLLQNRLSLNFDYYRKTTKDWLVVAPILATAGTDAPYINGGDVINDGIEFNVGWNDVVGKDFSYNIAVNGAYNRNKVGSIPNADGYIQGGVGELYNNAPDFYRAENGHAIGYFWGYKTLGIFQNEQQIKDWIAAGNGVLQSNPQPGDVIYYDVNHDGVIDDTDKVDLGNGMPKFSYGVNIGLYWKNFDLNIVGQGVAGYQIVQSYGGQISQYGNLTTEFLQRWTGEGTSNRMPRVTVQNINWQFSDLYIHDGDYFRISDITIGYNFAPLINQKWCSNLRVYFQMQNLYTFTKYNGMDPDIGYSPSAWASGVDLGFYPRSRNFVVGVNLAF